MNADIVCWGSNTIKTEVDTHPSSEGAESIFFRDDEDDTNYLRIFMTPAQMRTLRDQIDAALPKTVPEPEPEIATSETV